MTRAPRRVRVQVPASSANLGPGFDSIGLALGIWDEYVVEALDEPGLVVDVVGQGEDDVPRDESHLVVATMRRTFELLGMPAPAGLRLSARNSVPQGRGLGSSATAIVGAVAAALALGGLGTVDRDGAAAPTEAAAASDGDEQTRPVELDLALVGDITSALEGHPDNATASVHGGLTVSWMDELPDGVRGFAPSTTTLRPVLHPDVDVAVAVPEAQLETKVARAALPPTVSLADAARNSASAAVLVHALTVDPAYLIAGTRDWLHQEARRPAYAPSMQLVDDLRAGGHAATISGAGPSVLVLGTRESLAGLGEAPTGWRLLRPGIPTTGVTVSALPELPTD